MTVGAMLYIHFFLRSHSGACVSSCVGRVVKTGRGRDRCWVCMGNARKCRVECEMSGRGNWWVRSMNTQETAHARK